MNFHENLRHYRKFFNLSTQQMAEKIGVTANAYAGYEIRGREPRYEILCKMADVFDIPVDALLGRTTATENEIIKKRINNALLQADTRFFTIEMVDNDTKDNDTISFKLTTQNGFTWYTKLKKADISYNIALDEVVNKVAKDKRIYSFLQDNIINNVISESKDIPKEQLEDMLSIIKNLLVGDKVQQDNKVQQNKNSIGYIFKGLAEDK